MPGMKIHVYPRVYHRKSFEVGGFGELVATRRIHVVHEDIAAPIIQRKSAGSFHGFCRLLYVVVALQGIAAGEMIGYGYLDASIQDPPSCL